MWESYRVQESKVGQESQGVMEDKEDGGASLSFIRSLILHLSVPHAPSQPVF